MKYAIYFTWNDNIKDTFNVENAKERNFMIKDMIRRNCFKSISYRPIYTNGEYGKNVIVI